MKKVLIFVGLSFLFSPSFGQKKLDKFLQTKVVTLTVFDSTINTIRVNRNDLMKFESGKLNAYNLYEILNSLEGFQNRLNESIGHSVSVDEKQLETIKYLINNYNRRFKLQSISYFEEELKFDYWCYNKMLDYNIEVSEKNRIKDSMATVAFNKKLADRNRRDSIKRAEQYLKMKEKEKQDLIEYRNTCIKEFGKKMGNKVADGLIEMGMTEKMCRYAIGMPDHESETVLNKVSVKMLYYEDKGYIIGLKNGKVFSITR